MTTVQLAAGGDESPFDSIRRLGPDGAEFWSARDLMPLMAYAEWRDFAKITERARSAARNSGHDADKAFRAITQKVTGGRPRQDYLLTRFAAYLTAMNGDPNKAEVASAQAYFAARTREAEIATQTPAVTSTLSGTAAIRAMLDEIDRTNQRVLELAEAEARHAAQVRQIEARLDGIESRNDWFTALAYARISGLSTSLPFLRRLGTAAGRIARRDGQEPVQTQDTRWGGVNQYPVAALDEAAELLGVAPAARTP